MTVVAGYRPDPADSYAVARQRRLRQILLSYGVLTRDRLREAAHADGWEVPFDVALERAVLAGRVRALSESLFAAGHER